MFGYLVIVTAQHLYANSLDVIALWNYPTFAIYSDIKIISYAEAVHDHIVSLYCNMFCPTLCVILLEKILGWDVILQIGQVLRCVKLVWKCDTSVQKSNKYGYTICISLCLGFDFKVVWTQIFNIIDFNHFWGPNSGLRVNCIFYWMMTLISLKISAVLNIVRIMVLLILLITRKRTRLDLFSYMLSA